MARRRKEWQQLAALSLRTLLRNRLGEAEWRSDRDRGSGVAAREFLEEERVQHGRLLKQAEFGAGDRLDDTQRPDRTDHGVGNAAASSAARAAGARTEPAKSAAIARNFLILSEREGVHDSERVFEGPMSLASVNAVV